MTRSIFRHKETLLIGICSFVIYMAVGAYFIFGRDYLPNDSVSRIVNAWLVFYGTESKLASIGFVWPPVPHLLLLPLVWIRPLAQTWLAAVIVSALSMAIACVFVNKMAILMDVPQPWRLIIVSLFAFSPMILISGANGLSEPTLVAVFLMGCYWLLRFRKTSRNIHMLVAAGFFGLMPLVRYETALLTAFAAILVSVISWTEDSNQGIEANASKLEGRLLAYSAIAIYPIFLWILFNWMIMDSPVYFLSDERAATHVAAVGTAGLVTEKYGGSQLTLKTTLLLAFQIWGLTCLLGLLSSTVAIIRGVFTRDMFLVGLGVWPLAIPIVQGIFMYREASLPLVRYFILVIPAAMVTSLAIWKSLDSSVRANGHIGTFLKKIYWPAIVILTIISNLHSANLIANDPMRDTEYDSWIALTSREPVTRQAFMDGLLIGPLLPKILPEGSKVLIDTYVSGFSIILGAGDHKYFVDHTDPNYPEAIKNPPAYVDYILVPAPKERALLYEVNQIHPRLWEKGAKWAEMVDVLPTTKEEWRLYKITRQEPQSN